MNSRIIPPKFSIIIPALNEEKYIAQCIESLIEQDFCDFEAIIVDGQSIDRTREIVSQYSATDHRILLTTNPKKITPVAFNIGILNTTGEIVLTVGAHWVLPDNYLSMINKVCAAHPDIDCFGGRIIRKVNSDKGRAIEIARGSILGGGLSIRNELMQEQLIKQSNIAYIWRRHVFAKVGLFDERFNKNQDNEFNLRTLSLGMKTLYSPSIYFYYFAPDNFAKLYRQMFGYASFWPSIMVKHHRLLNSKFALPLFGLLIWLLLFLVGLTGNLELKLPLALLGVYLLIIIAFSFYISTKHKNKKLWSNICISYLVIHLSVSTGFLAGILKLANIPFFLNLWRGSKRANSLQ